MLRFSSVWGRLSCFLIIVSLAAYGHMGREELGVEWEKTNKVNELLEAVK